MLNFFLERIKHTKEVQLSNQNEQDFSLPILQKRIFLVVPLNFKNCFHIEELWLFGGVLRTEEQHQSIRKLGGKLESDSH